MTDKLKQIVAREVAKLPKEAQNAINSSDWGNTSEEIGKKYLFSEEEINDLQTITLTVLIGLGDFESMARDIESEIGTDQNEARKIAEEVEQRILILIYNNFEKNMRGSAKSKNPNWEQSVNFILSGGNYGAFLEEKKE